MGVTTLRRMRPIHATSEPICNSGTGQVRCRPSKRPRTKNPTTRQQGLPAAATCQPLPGQPLKLPPSRQCLKCMAKKMAYESTHFCCGDGEVELASNEYPPELVRLFTSQDEDALHFRKYARLYNNLFAFTSLGGTFDAKTQKGIYVFKLYGQIYHFLPNLLPADTSPKYLQLYFYDGQHEAENRASCFEALRQDVIDILMRVTKCNPYANFFRSLKELDVSENTRIAINKNTAADQRVYNAPLSDEVAVIWPENTSSSRSSSPHIVVSGKDNDSHRIMHFYGCYDPLQYPLLFPYGDCGWHQGLKKMSTGGRAQLTNQQNRVDTSILTSAEVLLTEEASRATQPRDKAEKHISCREYYCYKLQHRPNNLLLRAGRCFQQYIVDMYVKIENTRLDFFRNNQETIRAELYQGILDTMESGENSAANVGHRLILPPSFLGGPRDMKRRYLNAMALVQRYGKPDLFITMTCNPNWPEIKQELAIGEEAQNRPDIVSRVFRAKLLALKKQIMEKHVFGEVAALIYVVEFQKRGLPHAHFLIILKPSFKIKSPADFDKFVSAEIPSQNNTALRKSVLKHMMHGPCGHLNLESPCLKHKKSVGHCKYAYPKAFSNDTTNNADGYPVYRRRNNGETAVVRSATLDNRWVIPYNPYLLTLFECHLNVEICSTIQAVKYLYKYVYKGHDRVSFNVQHQNEGHVVDEIEQYQSGRWVSPCEAAWRIFGFDLFEMHPAVMPLQIHLPNMQTIQVRPHEQLNNIVSNEKRARTPLTEYFKVNELHGGTGYLYGEFTEYYRWDTTQKQWFLRKNKTVVIGRLAFVAPAEGERYFLRLETVTSPCAWSNIF
ncbi:hypothetical protein KSS87_003736 [Heliosperma pusillum]|nr:hypothetical protein KSS87_003736 [Heliosperma pusillum]